MLPPTCAFSLLVHGQAEIYSLRSFLIKLEQQYELHGQAHKAQRGGAVVKRSFNKLEVQGSNPAQLADETLQINQPPKS